MDVTIIIPTYNRLWSLPQAIQSCRNTQCQVEIIVIDDGSNDGTFAWLKSQADIIALTQSHAGKCYAVNSALSIAKGKYIRFLDSDDYLCTYSIDQQFYLAETKDFDLVTGGYTIVDEDSKTEYSVKWQHCDDFIAQQLGELDSSHYSAFLFKKTFIENIPHRQDFRFRDDRLFILEVALKNPKVCFYEQPVLFHRVHTRIRLQNTSGMDIVSQNSQHVQLYRKILDELNKSNRATTRRKKAAVKILWRIAHWTAIYNIGEGQNIAEWIYELDPGFIPPEKGFLGICYKFFGFKYTECLLKFRRLIMLS